MTVKKKKLNSLGEGRQEPYYIYTLTNPDGSDLEDDDGHVRIFHDEREARGAMDEAAKDREDAEEFGIIRYRYDADTTGHDKKWKVF